MASNTSGYVSDAPSQSEAIQGIIAENAATAVMTAALTLIIYDTTLVFSDELSLIWRRKWGLGTFLYLLARYGTFLQSFLNPLLSVSTSTSITYVSVTLQVILDDKQDIFSAFGIRRLLQATSLRHVVHGVARATGLFLARVYAVSGKNIWIITLLLILTATYLGCAIVILPFTSITTPIVSSTFHNRQAISKSSSSSASVISIIVLVIDAISVVVMLYRVWDLVHLRHNQPLLMLLVQQEVIRFAIIFIWSLEAAINEKARSLNRSLLDPKFAGLDSPLEDRGDHPNYSTYATNTTATAGASYTDESAYGFTAKLNRRPTTGRGIRSALSRISDHVVEEFGEPDMPPSIDIRNFHKEDSQMIQTEKGLSRSQTAMADEYPWACIEYSEMVDD
ncbi:hypothetical protein M422DRAFT_241172 [Sphaerobolus stellatus SS14]|nr:hypothetical protein M422DRAFT_241172 [Sphaerobolus stellatus SS14]